MRLNMRARFVYIFSLFPVVLPSFLLLWRIPLSHIVFNITYDANAFQAIFFISSVILSGFCKRAVVLFSFCPLFLLTSCVSLSFVFVCVAFLLSSVVCSVLIYSTTFRVRLTRLFIRISQSWQLNTCDGFSTQCSAVVYYNLIYLSWRKM